MYLYCQCGYPILVSAAIAGQESYVVLRDGKRGASSVPINHCPQCGAGLLLERLALRPPISLHWPLPPDTATDADAESDQAS